MNWRTKARDFVGDEHDLETPANAFAEVLATMELKNPDDAAPKSWAILRLRRCYTEEDGRCLHFAKRKLGRKKTITRAALKKEHTAAFSFSSTDSQMGTAPAAFTEPCMLQI